MKKLLAVFLLSAATSAWAGGLLTNTNQSAHFLRNPARDASTEIDAAYTNPAGLTLLDDGFHFSFSNQSAFQTRLITSEFAAFAGSGGNKVKEFKGTASAPVIPSIQAAYKTGNWVFSTNIAVSGGGGKATFNDGLPSFESGMALLPAIINKVGQNPNPAINGLKANQYSVDGYMTGSSFIYGAQVGGSYKINKMFSAYGGFRMNIVNNGYQGHLKNLKANPSGAMGYTGLMTSADRILDLAIAGASSNLEKANLELLKKASLDGAYLDVNQSGWGVSPIVGLNFNYQKLNIGMKYEFKTALNVQNKTVVDDTYSFKDGVNTPHDIPALFTVGLAYNIMPKLKASIGYHHFWDADAKMDKGKQQHISGGVNEVLIGVEYQLTDRFLLSSGYQNTRQGVKDAYQSDLSFALNSYSIGLGGKVKISEKVALNVAYFFTNYTDWTVSGVATSLNLPITNTYTRTNKVFGFGLDFSL